MEQIVNGKLSESFATLCRFLSLNQTKNKKNCGININFILECSPVGKIGECLGIRSYLTNKYLHILYYSMIYSHINYCLTPWFHNNKVIANKIQKVCNKFNNMFDRHIPSKKTTKTHKALVTSNNTKFLTLDQCLIKNSALFMYNYHKKSLPKIFRNFFFTAKSKNVVTRSNSKNYSRLLHLHS